MVTILLQQILDLLTGWLESFTTWANDMGDKVAAIKTNTDNLPGIKADTADIKDNTAAVITPIGAINSNVSAIASDVGSIKADTTVIKNNAGSIATSSGLTAAYTEDIADNTLDCKNRLVTIGSDTTQIRTDSDSIAADVTEIKNTLGLYLYNTIVTEDAEGSIANFDTDLQDYLQNAVVTIPADAGGISDCKVGYVDFNQLVQNGNFADGSVWTGYYGTLSIANNKGTLTCQDNSVFPSIQESITIQPNHKYIFIGEFTPSKNTTIAIYYKTSLIIGTKAILANTKTKLSFVFDSGIETGSGNLYLYCNRSNPTTMSSGDTCVYENVILIDLTQASGVTIADYLYSLSDRGLSIIKRIFYKDYYSYDVGGSLVSVESVNGSYYPNASVSFGSSITDGGSLDLTTGLLTVNTTPPTLIQLAPAPIKTLKGLNNIWADIGDIDITYRETLKHYLEKQEGN